MGRGISDSPDWGWGRVSVAGLVARRFQSAGMASRRSWQACLSGAGRSLDPAAEVSVRPKREESKERKKHLFSRPYPCRLSSSWFSLRQSCGLGSCCPVRWPLRSGLLRGPGGARGAQRRERFYRREQVTACPPSNTPSRSWGTAWTGGLSAHRWGRQVCVKELCASLLPARAKGGKGGRKTGLYQRGN